MGGFRSPVTGTHRFHLTKSMHKTLTSSCYYHLTGSSLDHLLLFHSTAHLIKAVVKPPSSTFPCCLQRVSLFVFMPSCPCGSAVCPSQCTLFKIAWLIAAVVSQPFSAGTGCLCLPGCVLHRLSDWACSHKGAVIPCLKDCHWRGPFNLGGSKLHGPSSLPTCSAIPTSLSIPLYFLKKPDEAAVTRTAFNSQGNNKSKNNLQ